MYSPDREAGSGTPSRPDRLMISNNLGFPTTARAMASNHHGTKKQLLAKEDATLRSSPTRATNPEQVTRFRSLSAGRAPQQGASEIIRSLYDKLGVSQNDFSMATDDNSSRKNRAMYPSNQHSNNLKTSSVGGNSVGDGQRAASSWIRGRQSPDSSSKSGAESNIPDNNHRRSRSLSQGRSNQRWPSIPYPSDLTTKPSSPRNYNNTLGSSTTSNANSTNDKTSFKRDVRSGAKERFNEEKKLDDGMSDGIPQEGIGAAISPSTPPSVKERLRLYGGSVHDQKNNNSISRFSIGGKTKTSNSPIGSKSVKTDFVGRSYQPKINIYNDCSARKDLMKDGDEQVSMCHSEYVRSQTSNSQCTLLKSSSNHASGDIYRRGTSCGSNNSKNNRGNNVANNFLTAIAPKSSPAGKKMVPSPLFEIQTTEDNETHSDTISISLSSVSADDYPRQNLSSAVHSLDSTLYSNRNYQYSDSRRTLNPPPYHQNERNRLSAYNNGSIISNGSNVSAIRANQYRCGAVDPNLSSPNKNGDHLGTVVSTDHQQLTLDTHDDIASSKMETIIEDRVNARMSEYETRMEKMILKFMQTVDEKMSSRIHDLESKIDSFNLTVKNSQQQQQVNVNCIDS